jgi:hypothetical protein
MSATDPISGAANILSILQQTLPQVITCLRTFTPDGRADDIIASLKQSAIELEGCVDTGILTKAQVDNLVAKIDKYVTTNTCRLLYELSEHSFYPVSLRARGN